MNKLDVRLADMHNHILYGVDDGSPDLEKSLSMLKIAYDDGIRIVCMTPHYHPKRGMASVDSIYDAFETLRDAAAAVFPDMDLYLGREVYFTSESLEKLENHEELRICGGGNVLVEFSTGTPASVISHAVSDVIMMGFTPIVAHVERYACAIDDKYLVEELKSKGAYIQVNADSVLGEQGGSVKRVVKWFLKNELVDFIASDAHDLHDRKPQLSKCYSYVAKKYGKEYADYMMCELPLRILEEE